MAEKKQIEPSKEEQIGFHKGSLSTLLKEREEMVKIVNIIDALLKAHFDALKNLGIEISVPAEKAVAKKKA